MKKALISNKRNKATFLYIPENQSSVKSIRIPVWGPKIVAGLLAVLVLYASYSAIALNQLKVQFKISQSKVKALTEVNDYQKVEIENLTINAQKIRQQLEENIAILEEVKAAVGLMDEESEQANSEDSLNTISGQDSDTALSSLNEQGYDFSSELASLQTSFINLSKQTNSQKTQIEESISTIKSRLDYLRCVPSIIPVAAKITASYGYRKDPFTSRGSEFHEGVDLAAPYGTKVAATGDGIVLFAGYQAGYGNMVIISHGYGFTTSYSHNSSLLVKKGDKVKRGQAISKVGSTGRSTGPHLHYEVKLNGKNVDPEKYF